MFVPHASVSIHAKDISSSSICMQLDRKTEMGLILMLLLACNQQRGIQTTTYLAKELQISESYLQQICKPLRVNQLVTSQRGPNGGYQLRKSAALISVAEIIKAFTKHEMTIKHIDSQEHKAWLNINLGLKKHLDQITLKMLIPANFQCHETESENDRSDQVTYLDNLII